jgi:hypothetical protein
VLRGELCVGPAERARNLRIGERAHRLADFGKVRSAAEIARHHPQHHAVAQPPQAPLDCGLVVALCAFKREIDLGTRETLPRGKFRTQVRVPAEQLRGVARKRDFLNRIGHLLIESTP